MQVNVSTCDSLPCFPSLPNVLSGLLCSSQSRGNRTFRHWQSTPRTTEWLRFRVLEKRTVTHREVRGKRKCGSRSVHRAEVWPRIVDSLEVDRLRKVLDSLSSVLLYSRMECRSFSRDIRIQSVIFFQPSYLNTVYLQIRLNHSRVISLFFVNWPRRLRRVVQWIIRVVNQWGWRKKVGGALCCSVVGVTGVTTRKLNSREQGGVPEPWVTRNTDLTTEGYRVRKLRVESVHTGRVSLERTL